MLPRMLYLYLCLFTFFSDIWSLGCVLYELCTLQHPVCFWRGKILHVNMLFCCCLYFLWFQFLAHSWRSLILKVCRGSYAPLPSHLSYELHYLIKHMFKTNPRDRPSVHTILNAHRVSRLLRRHLCQQVHHWTLRRQFVYSCYESTKLIY